MMGDSYYKSVYFLKTISIIHAKYLIKEVFNGKIL